MRSILHQEPNGDGTFTVWWSDGTISRNIHISGGGTGNKESKAIGEAIKRGAERIGLPPIAVGGGTNPGSDVPSLGEAIGHIGTVGGSIFNPFEIVIKSFTEDTPETHAIRAQARKLTQLSILIVLFVLFLYLAFK
jgi:hypothetical protein